MGESMNSCSTKYNLLSNYYSQIKDQFGEKNAEILLRGESIDFADDAPFLSVVMRTQGKRTNALKEALLCLNAQTDQDFEVIVMAHNVDDETRTGIERIISQFPDEFQKHVRLVPITGGTRTTPLITGFENARGMYISIYDDDDLIFDNWVETFHELYKSMPGRILHAFAVSQNWGVNEDGSLIALSPTKPEYCCRFNMIDQLTVNHCPTMSLAFPAYAFRMLGINFDEGLSTTEDWDFLMRVAFVCGVADSENVTSIYRKWTNSENSYTQHDNKEWKLNYKKIRNRLKKYYVPVLAGSVIEVQDEAQNEAQESCCQVVDQRDSVKMYYDTGTGFCEENSLMAHKSDVSEYNKSFTNIPKNSGICSVRIDPVDTGNIVVESPCVKIVFEDKTEKIYGIRSLKHNGKRIGESLVFLKSDPQIWVDLGKPMHIDSVLCSIDITSPIPDRVIDAVVIKRSLLYRILRRIYRLLKGVM